MSRFRVVGSVQHENCVLMSFHMGANMSSGRRWLPVACVAALAVFASGCGSNSAPAATPATGPTDGEAGTSHIDVEDVRGTPLQSRFNGKPVPVTGKVKARTDGCVTVIIDGVERLPLWPRGTTVEQSGDDDRYVVKLSGGVTLTADGSSGDGFEAAGIVSDGTVAEPVGAGPPGKAETFLAFCRVQASPIAFPDAATFRTRKA